jgi:HAD superfamily hydrolase (TIGR01509 family)
MDIKAIIFDLDGTILNTEPMWVRAAQTVLHDHGITLDAHAQKELENHVVGVGLQKVSHYLKTAYDLPESVEKLYDTQRLFVEKIFDTSLEFVEGFETFIKKVIDLHLPRAIATNTQRETADKIVKIMGLEYYFGNHIYTITDVDGVGKPSPNLYLYTARKLQVEPSECIVIEDSMPGIVGAKNAGMYCIGINTGRNRAKLAQADVIVDRFDEIDPRALIRPI